jgi:hypothetical protein
MNSVCPVSSCIRISFVLTFKLWMDSVCYSRIDETDVFYIDLRIDKPYSFNVLCRSNDVGIMWCGLIGNDCAIECLLVSCVYAIM